MNLPLYVRAMYAEVPGQKLEQTTSIANGSYVGDALQFSIMYELSDINGADNTTALIPRDRQQMGGPIASLSGHILHPVLDRSNIVSKYKMTPTLSHPTAALLLSSGFHRVCSNVATNVEIETSCFGQKAQSASRTKAGLEGLLVHRVCIRAIWCQLS